MRIRSAFAAMALLALAVPALAEEKAAAPGQPSQAEMEAMMKSMTPGLEHQRLAKMAGDWTFTSTMWMPGAPPVKSDGTMHAEMMLGGRYLSATWMGNMMGQAFEGHGTSAYDNVTKQYESTWIDNMGTGIMNSTGTCDADGKVCSYTDSVSEPMAGKKITTHSKMSWIDDNSFKFEMFGPGPDGKEAKMMEIVTKRKM
jgi:hypothetical protein